MAKKKQETVVNSLFYKIKTNNNKIILEIKEEQLAKSKFDILTKEFDKLTNLLMNIIDRQSFDGKITLEDYYNTQILLIVSEKILYYLDRCLDGLYLIYSPKMNLLKIGITNNINERIKSISRDVDDDGLELLGFHYEKSSLEKFLHDKFKDDNVRFIGKTGTEHREWFNNKNYIKTYFNTI